MANASGNLSVGDEGRLTVTVRNDGPGDAENAVVRLLAPGENVEPQSTEVAVGSLAAGASTTVSFPVEVTTSADPGPRQFSFVVDYDDTDGTARTSDRLPAQVDVGPEREEFRIVRRSGPVDVGGTATVTLELTNERNGTVRNVNAKAFVDDPLSVDRDEAFVAELAPGESVNVTFEVSASGDAPPGTYPLSVDFQYDTAAGDTKLSEPYEVPVEVREPEGGGLFGSLWAVLVVLALLLVGVGVAVTVRRQRDEGDGGD
nr:CARDB domain-containing protein [Halomarina rubra]